ncbi:hypothetical protein [Streptomyces sp. NPDC058304]|uniref:hypothetical protein n=1 Tax=Streptomyces sp. NPDC058304 TaxID=3346437 RepID=UPI0036F163FE
MARSSDPAELCGYPNELIEQLRQGWLHSERWDLDCSSEFTALALTGPTGY